jgi:hypothetical protein
VGGTRLGEEGELGAAVVEGLGLDIVEEFESEPGEEVEEVAAEGLEEEAGEAVRDLGVIRGGPGVRRGVGRAVDPGPHRALLRPWSGTGVPAGSEAGGSYPGRAER